MAGGVQVDQVPGERGGRGQQMEQTFRTFWVRIFCKTGIKKQFKINGDDVFISKNWLIIDKLDGLIVFFQFQCRVL